MPFLPGPGFSSAFVRTQVALGMTQEQFGRLLGVSRRTMSRWRRYPGVSEDHVYTMAKAVHPKDAALAAELAGHIGKTLESLRIVAPPPPAPAPPPPPKPLPPVSLLVDSIVCAAADALETKPAAVRAALSAAFGRAQQMGIGVDEVVAALSPKPARVPPKGESKGKA
jgi:hypothetical protein